MRAGVTGATGFEARRLVARLIAEGHIPVAFTRDVSRARSSFPASVELRALSDLAETSDGLDVLVNLAGEPVVDGRWNDARKHAIRTSRIEMTRSVVEAIANARVRPRLLVSASAVGYYGDRGNETLDETASPGEDFLARVCVEWEAEARKAEALGVRVLRLRIGVVLGDSGGALARMVTPFRFGMGGPIGNGRQYVPWIHQDDLVGMVHHALVHDDVQGVWNATAPEPVRNRELAAAIGRVLRRPAVLPVPGFVLRLAFGEVAGVILKGCRAVPRAALAAGYGFRYPSIESALRDVLCAGPGAK